MLPITPQALKKTNPKTSDAKTSAIIRSQKVKRKFAKAGHSQFATPADKFNPGYRNSRKKKGVALKYSNWSSVDVDNALDAVWKQRMAISAAAANAGYTSDNGYITTKIFFDFLLILSKQLNAASNTPMIVICDGHTTRFSAARLSQVRKNHIVIFIGVPNATHIYQTLDDQTFLQYNNARKRLQRQWKRTQHTTKFKLHDEIETKLNALKEVMDSSTRYIQSAAKNCGFLPFDPDKLK